MTPKLLFLPLYLTIGCQSTATDSAEQLPSSPQCLTAGAQYELWERLGSPIAFEEGIPVAPSLLVVDGALWLYYSLRDGLHDTVYLLQSSDGQQWSEPILITGFDSETEIKHFNVAQTTDGFRAFLGGGSISSLRSDNGIQWTVEGQQLVAAEDFDQWGQLYPTPDPTSDRIWYSGFSGTTYAIGLAERNGDTWSNQGPVLQPDNSTLYENTAVAQSSVLSTENGLRMWYGGYDTSQTNPGPWRILSAVSNDGINWDKQGLALDLTEAGEEAYSVREPSIVQWNGYLWMAYVSMGDDSIYRLRLARCH